MSTLHPDRVADVGIEPDAWVDGQLLIEAARRREPDAVAALVERMMVIPSIVAAFNARWGSPLSADELVDVSQDTATVVWKKLGAFQGESKLETWFYGVARFEFANTLRRKLRDSARVSLDDSQLAQALPSQDLDLELVHQALERLPADDAAVLKLYYFESLTLDQVAARLGAPASSARRRFYRGLEHLRVHLEACERKAER